MTEGWWISLGCLLPLACKASSPESAKLTMAESGYAVHQGDFLAVPAPPELAEWLDCAGGAGHPQFGNKVPGGWQPSRGLIPVWGASGIRVVEKHLIAVPPGTMPSAQGWPNG